MSTVSETNTEVRILDLLKTSGPQTSEEAGNALGMTAPGAQQHFARLKARGLVVDEARRQGRGRPRKYWQLTEDGHGRFPDRHAELTVDIIASVRSLFGKEGLDRLIAHREAESLGHYRDALRRQETLGEKIATLSALRSAEGYMADWRPVSAEEFLFFENHCPICAAAKSCQGFCRSELEIFRAALGDGVTVEREEHIVTGARRCTYRISASKA
jgi:predicted ArsR family transcriptional regulator